MVRRRLILPAEKGHLTAITALASLRLTLIYQIIYGATPASVAAQNGHVAVIKELARLGADLNKPDNNGATPAYIAAQRVL